MEDRKSRSPRESLQEKFERQQVNSTSSNSQGRLQASCTKTCTPAESDDSLRRQASVNGYLRAATGRLEEDFKLFFLRHEVEVHTGAVRGASEDPRIADAPGDVNDDIIETAFVDRYRVVALQASFGQVDRRRLADGRSVVQCDASVRCSVRSGYWSTGRAGRRLGCISRSPSGWTGCSRS